MKYYCSEPTELEKEMEEMEREQFEALSRGEVEHASETEEYFHDSPWEWDVGGEG